MSSNSTCLRHGLLGSLLVVSLSLASCVAKDAGVGDSLLESDLREAGADSRNTEPDSGAEQGPREPAEASEPANGGDAAVEQEPHATDSNDTDPDDTEEDKPLLPGPQCGNGIVDGDEECDQGPSNGIPGAECTQRCVANVCGDGHIGAEEACDDGNNVEGDACTHDCQEPVAPCSCGDGQVDEACNDQCDEGLENGSVDSFCTDRCTLAWCGDGLQNNGEECDTGDLTGVPGNPCTSVCQDNVCGDGHRGPDEECDDGNLIDGDSCTMCMAPPQPHECGDGVIDADESCDFGNANGVPGGDCTAVCQLDTCGDGHRGFEELCDDGNLIDDDTCPSSCGIEFPEPLFDAGANDAGDAG